MGRARFQIVALCGRGVQADMGMPNMGFFSELDRQYIAGSNCQVITVSIHTVGNPGRLGPDGVHVTGRGGDGMDEEARCKQDDRERGTCELLHRAERSMPAKPQAAFAAM